MTEKQKNFLPEKEDKERLCFTLATMMRQLFNDIERSFWPKGTGTKNWNHFSGFLCPRGLNLISFIAFYSAKKDLSMTLNSMPHHCCQGKTGSFFIFLSWQQFLLFLSHSCTNKWPINILHKWYHLFVAAKLK